MSKLSKSNQSGFTIIEVVLALAIGAMIIGMVFIALPNLQKQRRDTARRNDLSRFMGQLEAYSGNNNGKYPAEADIATAGTGFVDKYVKAGGGIFEDPKVGTYTVDGGGPADANVATLAIGTIIYSNEAKCDGEDMVDDPNNARAVAAVMPLERGHACLSNQ